MGKHRGNRVEREFPPGQMFWVQIGEALIPVWATNDEEALAVAQGVLETDGELYGRK